VIQKVSKETAEVFIEKSTGNIISEIGKIIKCMEMGGYIGHKINFVMKDNFKKISSTELVQNIQSNFLLKKYSQLIFICKTIGRNILEILWEINDKVKVEFIFWMDGGKVILRIINHMVKEHGIQQLKEMRW
jgi:hypothetical protein